MKHLAADFLCVWLVRVEYLLNFPWLYSFGLPIFSCGGYITWTIVCIFFFLRKDKSLIVPIFHHFVPSKPMWLDVLCRTSASRCACLQDRDIFCHPSVGPKYKLLQGKCHSSATFALAFISDRVNVIYGSTLWTLTWTSWLSKSEAVCELFQRQVLAVLCPDHHSDSASDAQLVWGLVHGKLCHTCGKLFQRKVFLTVRESGGIWVKDGRCLCSRYIQMRIFSLIHYQVWLWEQDSESGSV